MPTMYQKINGQLVQVAPPSELEKEAEALDQRVIQMEQAGGYVLPVADTTTLGGVKPDGVTIDVDATGKISVIAPDEPDPADTPATAPSATPLAGTSDKYARADHVHPKGDLFAWGGGAAQLTIDSDTYLTAAGPRRVFVTASKEGCKVILPVLDTVTPDGVVFLVGCIGTNAVTVEDAAGNTVGDKKGVIQPGKSRVFYLTDASGSGTWVSDQWGGNLTVTVSAKPTPTPDPGPDEPPFVNPVTWTNPVAKTPVVVGEAATTSVYGDAVQLSSGDVLVASDIKTNAGNYGLGLYTARLGDKGTVTLGSSQTYTSGGDEGTGLVNDERAISLYPAKYGDGKYAFLRRGLVFGHVQSSDNTGIPMTNFFSGELSFKAKQFDPYGLTITDATKFPMDAKIPLMFAEDSTTNRMAFVGPGDYTCSNAFNPTGSTDGFYAMNLYTGSTGAIFQTGAGFSVTTAVGGNATTGALAPTIMPLGSGNIMCVVGQDATQALIGFPVVTDVDAKESALLSHASDIDNWAVSLGTAKPDSQIGVYLGDGIVLTMHMPADSTEVIAQAYICTPISDTQLMPQRMNSSYATALTYKNNGASYVLHRIDNRRALAFGLSAYDETKLVAMVVNVTDGMDSVSGGTPMLVASDVLGTPFFRGSMNGAARNCLTLVDNETVFVTYSYGTGSQYYLNGAVIHLSETDITAIDSVEVVPITTGSRLCTWHVPTKFDSGVLVAHQDIAGSSFRPAFTAVNFD